MKKILVGFIVLIIVIISLFTSCKTALITKDYDRILFYDEVTE